MLSTAGRISDPGIEHLAGTCEKRSTFDEKDIYSYSDKPNNFIRSRRQSAQEMTTSQFYPDTAPRSIWRPQLDAWIRKHPSKFRELSPIITTSSTSRIHKKTNYSLTSSSSSSSLLSLTCSSSSHSFVTTPDVILSSSPQLAKHSNRPISPAVLSDSSEIFSPIIGHGFGKGIKDMNCEFSKLPSPPQSPRDLQDQSNMGNAADNAGMPFNNASSNSSKRRCISCGSGQSPCWRPSWSTAAGQLCNSCGLRYKKTGARCLSSKCGRIPAKCEWMTMKEKVVVTDGRARYHCLLCGGEVEVRSLKCEEK